MTDYDHLIAISYNEFERSESSDQVEFLELYSTVCVKMNSENEK